VTDYIEVKVCIHGDRQVLWRQRINFRRHNGMRNGLAMGPFRQGGGGDTWKVV